MTVFSGEYVEPARPSSQTVPMCPSPSSASFWVDTISIFMGILSRSWLLMLLLVFVVVVFVEKKRAGAGKKSHRAISTKILSKKKQTTLALIIPYPIRTSSNTNPRCDHAADYLFALWFSMYQLILDESNHSHFVCLCQCATLLVSLFHVSREVFASIQWPAAKTAKQKVKHTKNLAIAFQFWLDSREKNNNSKAKAIGNN